MKKKTFSTSRHTFQRGLPMGSLVSVDLKLVHRNRSVTIAHISTWIKLRKVLSWENFLLTRSSFNKSTFSGRAFVNKSKAPSQPLNHRSFRMSAYLIVAHYLKQRPKYGSFQAYINLDHHIWGNKKVYYSKILLRR